MSATASPGGGPVRAAEVVGVLSLAIDLATDVTLEHGLGRDAEHVVQAIDAG